MKTKTIKQKVTFKASSHEIFEMLMDSEKHSKFTGDSASISRKVGGKLEAYSGYITGKNVDLIPDKKIVQLWRGSDWPEEVFSVAHFELEKTSNGTKLTFLQIGVPENQYKDISEGWVEHYWDKMKKTLEK